MEERTAPGQVLPVFLGSAIDPFLESLLEKPAVTAVQSAPPASTGSNSADDSGSALLPVDDFTASLAILPADRTQVETSAADQAFSTPSYQPSASLPDLLADAVSRPVRLRPLAAAMATGPLSVVGSSGTAFAPRADRTAAFQRLLAETESSFRITATLPVATPAQRVNHFTFQMESGQEGNAAPAIALARSVGASVSPTSVPGFFEVRGTSADLAGLMKYLDRQPGIASAEVPSTVHVALTPNDPSFTSGSLWGLNGTFGIKGPEAWDFTTGSTQAVVSVIDTGIDYNHPDLYKNIWINQGEIPAANRAAIQANPSWDVDSDGKITFWDLNNPINQGPGKIIDVNLDGRISGADALASVASGGWANGASDDGGTFVDDIIGWDFVNNDNNPYDDNSHGTHVAGTIGAIGNNSLGVVGVNWKTQLMGLKILDAGGSGSTSAAAQAVYYATDHGSRVSNNSWGGGTFSGSLSSAITYARDHGHIFVAAAGNSGTNNDTSPFYPASYAQANVIAVAATTNSGAKASFSNFGAKSVDLGAPGSSILSTQPGGTYGYKSGTSMATPHVAGVVGLVLGQHPNWTYTDIVNRVLSTTTPLSSLAGITVTGGLVNAAAAVASGPEIQVLDGGTDLVDGVSTVNMSTLTGVPVNKIFTVRNAGTDVLTLGSTINLPSGFSLVSGFGSTSLAPGASTTFTIRLNASTAGTYTGQLSFTNNDSNENPFNFNLTGVVSSSVIVDDGGAGFSTTGGWTTYSGQGFQNDVTYSAAGSGSNVATWTFALSPGTYRVSATWTPYSNRATNAPYSVLDGATPLGTVRINQELAPNDRSDSGAWWEDLGTFTINGSALVVKLSNDANEYVIADGVRVESTVPLAPAPEIQVLDGVTNIADGVGSVSFGSTPPGTPISKTFTVKNIGTANLTLTPPISVPPGFTLTSSFASTTLAPGATTTFTVRLDATTAGTFSGIVSFANNDSDENPFNFTVSGTVVSRVIIDDGSAGFSTSGSWVPWGGQGFQNDVTYAAAGSGSSVATWSFAVTPGTYRVSATWSIYPNRATNAPYTVFNGATALATIRVNQELAPNDLNDAGAWWENLGTFTVTGSTLVVRLSNDANEYVIADAIRIERI